MAEYKRTPIIINKNAIALIHLFTKFDSLDDCYLHDIESYYIKNSECYKDAANQLIEQLEGEWCMAFIEELALLCVDKYWNNANGNINYQTSFKERINKIINNE